MAKNGKLLIFLFLFLISCSTSSLRSDIQIPKVDLPEKKVEEKTQPVPQDFRIENPPINPLQMKRISVNVRATPLRDILLVIAKDAGLNLILEKDVDPNTPITLVLTDVTLQDAIEAVISSTDYFYKIERNILTVKATETKIFHLSMFPVHQTYTTEVGGDILGGVTGQLTTGGTAGGGVSTEIKGNVSKTEKSDDAAYKFWDSIEKSLTTILSRTPAQPVGPPATQPVAQPLLQTTEYFIINRLTGTVMVTATKKNMQKVEQYLNTIKKVMGRQVLIEAKVIEVTLSDSLKYGIDWSFLREWSHGTHHWSIGGGTTDFTTAVPFTSPYSDIRFSLTTTAIKDFSVIIKALSQFGDIRTLSNPRINIMNGQTSLLTVGRNFTFISKAESNVATAVGGTPIITYTVETSNLLSGLIIGIVPYIDDKGEISLTITPVIANLIDIREQTFGTPGAQTVIQLPTVDLRELSTTVKIKDGEILIIGGLIKKEESLAENKTPLLGDIPILGSLFKGYDRVKTNTELVILLQPRIVSQ
ncbi:MAG: pilus (MSHA type) biogenesis protein MshL [Thermodesulfovibrio sp.]|nr:pilus (MSHA type) biogenesis protein MshL [Thermodesulfovibrio sp.]